MRSRHQKQNRQQSKFLINDHVLSTPSKSLLLRRSHIQPWFHPTRWKGLRRLSCWLGQDCAEVAFSSESGTDRVNLEDVDEVLDVVVAPGTAFL
jgi:uncharacterized protein YchJ